MDKSNTSLSSIGHKLWNKIAKTQSLKMTRQFIPVINEIFGTHYPMDTPIRVLPSRYPVPKSRSAKKYPYIEPDLNLLINEREHYHFEVQMSNDKMIGIRITEYGFHHGLMHSTELVRPGIGTIRFPQSAVLYLGEYAAYPTELETTLILPDRTRLRHTARGVRVQDYSLEEIHRKHLLVFLPFSLIRLRPKLKYITKEELTIFINSIIFILNKELQDAFISETEYEDYMQMVYDAANQILVHRPALFKEVEPMMSSVMKLPSDYKREIADLKEQLLILPSDYKQEIAELKAQLIKLPSDYKQEIAELKQEIAELKEQLSKYSSDYEQKPATKNN